MSSSCALGLTGYKVRKDGDMTAYYKKQPKRDLVAIAGIITVDAPPKLIWDLMNDRNVSNAYHLTLLV